MTEPTDRERLSGLVHFAAELLKAREKTTMRLAEYGLGVFHQKEIADLPGIRFGRDETWLAIDRLRPTEGPGPDPIFDGWVVGDLDDPVRGPRLEDRVALVVTVEEASDLAEAGILEEADVHPYRTRAERQQDEDGNDVDPPVSATHVYVVLRTERMPEWQALFDEWKARRWQPWADSERPRRRTIALYQVLYRLHSLMQAGSDSNVPEVVWGIGVARWEPEELPQIDMPLIEKPCELLLEEDGTLVVGPRSLPAVVNLRPFRAIELAEADRAQGPLSSQVDARAADPDVPLHPHDPVSFEDILIGAANRLSSSARFVPAVEVPLGEKLPLPAGELAVYGTWVIYARPRSEDLRQQDLRRIEQEIRKASEDRLQKPLVGLVKPPSDEKIDAGVNLVDWGFTRTEFGTENDSRNGGGAGAGRGSGGGVRGEPEPAVAKRSAYFFPLPFNAEQAEIVDTLEREDIAVVKGPPGTGKTHTIANVIAHYMATGRRVLVTARTAEAIAAVQDKLPAELRTMTIAVVHSDREGAKQLEEAVQALAGEAASAQTHEIERRIIEIQDEIVRLEQEIVGIDASLGDIARANLGAVDYSGTDYLPMDLARVLAEEEPQFAWFTDRPAADGSGTRLGELVDRIVQLRSDLGGDLVYLGSSFPAPEVLPKTADLTAAMRHEASRKLAAAEDYSGAPLLVLDTLEDERRAREAHVHLIKISAEISQFSPSASHLYARLVEEELAGGHAGPVRGWIDRVVELAVFRARISPQPIRIPDFGSGERAEKLEMAVARLAAGEKPFGFAAALFAQDLKRTLDEVRIGDAAPRTPEDWSRVKAYRRWRAEHDRFFAQWNEEPRLPRLADDPDEFLAAVKRLREEFERACDLAAAAPTICQVVSSLFPYGLDVDKAVRSGDLAPILFAFRANLKDDADRTHPALETMRNIADSGRGPLFDNMADLARAIAEGTCTEPEIVEARAALTRELQHLAGRSKALEEFSACLELLAKLGAPAWAKRLADPSLDTREIVRPDWEKAWAWAAARHRIDGILGLENPATLSARKAELVTRRARRFERLIRERTLRGLKGHLTDKIKQALVLFTTAMRNLGAGTGQSAHRWRRQIREAALDAAPAAPVWIMPEYRVAEQLPATLGSFDLVVLDEASQSDVTALGALARGKKWLVVGDEQQVSPSSVGMPQAQIDALRAQYLRHITIRNAIDQDTSIFDIASMMFPSAHVMLREHFRCVAPIIQFSTRFYGGRLIPLRIPKASERLDPPLIDIFVADGVYKSKWNPQERDVIVEEIAKIVTDPAMRHRTIAVISLVGSVQAEQVERALISHPMIGHEAIERHRIICGDSRTMQGQERDIVFLSMVQAGKVPALTARSMAQRFNVAMSRGRDRVYLVRSLAVSQLKAEDLKRQVIEHFAQPMPSGRKLDGKGVLDRCQSGLERDVCRRLLDAGYRVRSQVEAGPYAIDLVVEGAEDRRLAIELDGDKFHGPDRWDDDMRRQAALERAGWVFWRVFGSQWNTEAEFWWSDLVATLERLGIQPIGADASPDVYTEYRRVAGGKLVGAGGLPMDDATDLPIAEDLPAGDDAVARPDAEVAAEVPPVPLAPPEYSAVPQAAAAPAGETAAALVQEATGGLVGVTDPGITFEPFVEERREQGLREELFAIAERMAAAPDTAPAADVGGDQESMRGLYGGLVVTPGATVRVRYLDRDKVMTIVISDRENAPDKGVVHVGQPLAQALLGAGVDEVVAYEVNGAEQEVLVEEIFDAVSVAAE
ncbi:AAA domain-containing protein [Salinarimonas sp. NSM]|uniref:AAA domain-containing protein n=1 Tax=Salinarimonas sp. NSM TaxID=3458003 RepID=UPI004036F3AE